MHVPDGFLDAPTSLATGVVAVVGVGVALRRSRHELDERAVPLAGLTSAFVFAAQMVNFPVGLGTSGHLMGGALAATLVGPWTAVLCLSVVLLVQGLLFADGGLTALGTNMSLMGITSILVAWLVTRAVLALLPRRPASVVPAAAAGAFVSVVAAALAFVGLFAVGGQAALPLGPLTASMLAVHSAIGVGEAILTALTVSAVVAVRPDLVHAARGRLPRLVLHAADGTVLPVGPTPARATSGRPVGRLLVGGGLVTLLLVAGGASVASSAPDGLERVATDQGFLATAREHVMSGSVLAEYGSPGGVPVALAGVIGVLAVVGLGLLAFTRGRAAPDAADAIEPAADVHG